VGSVFDVRVAQPQLQPPRIVASISKQMPARVPEHMWVGVGQACTLARRRHHLANVRSRHWSAITFASKHKRPGSSATYLTQGAEFITLDRMDTGDASFQSPDVEMRPREIDLIPLKINCFTDAQTVTRHEQDQSRVTLAIAPLASGADELA
jgi:hypothetical protein